MTKHDLPDDWQDLKKYDDPKYDQDFERLMHDIKHGPDYTRPGRRVHPLVFLTCVLILSTLTAVVIWLLWGAL
jgi:hypothetical protein